MYWKANLVDDDTAIRDIALSMQRVAVLGIKTDAQSSEPAYYVPQYLADAGKEVVPVPVYYPDATEILGRPVFRKLSEIPGDIDVVNVFRRAKDIPPHVDDLLAARPDVVWFQSGIRNDEVAEQLARAGIRVVQDRCLMVEHRRARVWPAGNSTSARAANGG